MKRVIYILFAIAWVSAAVSCIRDDRSECPPPTGQVAVTLRVEKFQTRSPYRPQDYEEDFSRRIHSLSYLLYAGERLIEQGDIDDLPSSGGTYIFRRNSLPMGKYRIALVANTPADVLTGVKDAPERYYIAYKGEEEGDDHFRADLPFEVDTPGLNEFETVLLRVHGVTRFHVENLPPDISAIEVTLDNIGERMPLCGDPDLGCEVSKRVIPAAPASRSAGSCSLGTFCTLPDKRSAWKIKLYGADADTPIYDRVVTDTLRVECNQLLDLKMRFRDGDLDGGIDFSVDVDTSWDGSNEVGGGSASPRTVRVM